MTKKLGLVDGKVPFRTSLKQSLFIVGAILAIVLVAVLMARFGSFLGGYLQTPYFNNMYLYSASNWLVVVLVIFNLTAGALGNDLTASRPVRGWRMSCFIMVSTLTVAFVCHLLSSWILRFYIFDGLIATVLGGFTGLYVVDGRLARSWRFIFDNRHSAGQRTGRLTTLAVCAVVVVTLAWGVIMNMGPDTHYQSLPYVVCVILGTISAALSLRPAQPAASTV